MIKSLERFLESIEKTALIILFCVMIGLSFVQVVLRAGFSTGLLWADVFLRHLVLWVGFLGAVLAVSQNKHFAMDVMLNFLPPKVQKTIQVLIDFFALAMLYLLSGSAVKFIKDDAQSGSILFSLGGHDVPSAWMNAIIPAAFILLGVHFAFKTMRDVESLLSPSRPTDPGGLADSAGSVGSSDAAGSEGPAKVRGQRPSQ